MTEPEFIEKVQKYKNMVYRLAVNYLRNISDAEDISQEVFLKFLKRNQNFKSEEEEKAWLIRITINASKDLLKSAWFKKTVPIDENIPCEERESTDLFRALMSLTPKYRTVIYLYYYEEYPINEICKILRIKKSTAQMRLVRARSKLKEILEKEFDFNKEGIYEAGF